MEFNDDQESYSGGRGGPIVGAIFMANRRTRKECLSRKLFGLPPPQANFVKKVKSGMLLFLFEFEERKLYGVFQASSDGAMNIVPYAFRSSGKQFPAQIRIKSIWYCQPLVESDFRPAIRDNYYTSNKFNLGLSKDQVAELLWLFESRKIKVSKFRSPLPREKHANRSLGSNCRKVGVSEDNEHLRDNDKNKLTMDNKPASLARDPGFRLSDLNVSSVSGQCGLDPDNSIFRGRDKSFFLGHASSRTWSPPGSRKGSVQNGDSSVKKYDGNVRVFEDDDNGKSRHIMDNKLAGLARDPAFRQSDLNISSASGQYILYPDNSIFRGRDESFSLGHVSSHTWSPPGSRKGSVFGGDSSVKRYGGMDALTSLEDYIPLAPENHFDHSRYSRYENVNLTSNRDQEGLTFRDPPLATIHSRRDVHFGRENLSSSVNPGNDSPYIPDYSFPAASRHEGSPYSSFREGLNFGNPSLAPVPSSGRVNFGREDFRSSFISGTDPPYIPDYHTPASLQHEHTPPSLQHEGPPSSNFHPSSNSDLHSGDDPLTQNFDPCEQRDQDTPSKVRKDDYGAHVGLKSDQSERISVFSRLKSSGKVSVDDGDGCIGDNIDQADMTSEQLMDMLHQSLKHWKSATKISRHKTELADDEISKSNSMHSVSENYPLANLEQQCDDVVVEDTITIVNFKRRSKMREVKGVMDGSVEEGDDFSGMSLRKRRKLSRPSFVSGGTHETGVIGDGSTNLSILAQENHECNDVCGETLVNGGESIEFNNGVKEKYEGNRENSELLVHSSGVEAPEKPTSENSDVQVVHPVCSEDNSGKTKRVTTNLQDFKVRVEAYVQELSKSRGDKNPDREIVIEDTHIYREGDTENAGSRELEKCVDASSACEGNRKTESLLPKFDNTKVDSSTENSDLKVRQKESSESELSEEVDKAKAVVNGFIESKTNLQSCSNHKS